MKTNKYAGDQGGNHRHDGENLKPLHTNNGLINEIGRRTNVWDVVCGSIQTKDKVAFKHPAMFPEKLAEDHILSWSNEGDVVYDCFMGSGTTAKMALINNRHYIGSEISKEYCDIQEERLKSMEKNLETWDKFL